MNLLTGINKQRRALMRIATKNLGNSVIKQQEWNNEPVIKNVLLCRPNHRLGNLLLITPLMQDVLEAFPNCKVDLFVKGNLAPILFKNYENIGGIIQLPKKPFQHLIKYTRTWMSIKRKNYDIIINVDKGSASGKLAVRFANSQYKFFGSIPDELPSQEYAHSAKYPVYAFRTFLKYLGYKPSNKPIPPLDLRLTPLEMLEGEKTLRDIVKNNNRTICLFTYATGDKCYPVSWWRNFYEALLKKYPYVNFIEVLPIEKISNLSFKIPSFYSRNVREIGSLIANTDVFIGADSGIMHLASSVKTPTIGLFSVTSEQIYGPYDNTSMGINTNLVGAMEMCFRMLDRILE